MPGRQDRRLIGRIGLIGPTWLFIAALLASVAFASKESYDAFNRYGQQPNNERGGAQ